MEAGAGVGFGVDLGLEGVDFSGVRSEEDFSDLEAEDFVLVRSGEEG